MIPPRRQPTVLALFGPTGVGKTAVAIALACRLRGRGEDPVAVSADALQVYEGLETVTAAPTREERAALEHRLVGVVPVTERFSAGAYARRAHAEIDALLAEGRRPIVVGGTGLYLRAALADLDLRPPPDPVRRNHWRTAVEQRGPESVHTVLAQRDPQAAATIDPHDRQRIVRALELLDAGRRPPGGPALWTTETRHPTALFGLVMNREALARQIDARVDAMVAAGAAEEVRSAAARGASDTARKALGFDELLRGDAGALKVRTRRYAKRQLTWMRKLPGVTLLDVTGRAPDDVAGEVLAAAG
ncbi:MAG TPA: tRNA (adenosine(37)-N6)-dimethylallyltransferase MiaA [Solirubrobacteraceae bacterium]|nr:tRNA (adenosine(37)-N6)-dimethylallyltransferase MiaA [Solirubrobacteraceae bacterium]